MTSVKKTKKTKKRKREEEGEAELAGKLHDLEAKVETAKEDLKKAIQSYNDVKEQYDQLPSVAKRRKKDRHQELLDKLEDAVPESMKGDLAWIKKHKDTPFCDEDMVEISSEFEESSHGMGNYVWTVSYRWKGKSIVTDCHEVDFDKDGLDQIYGLDDSSILEAACDHKTDWNDVCEMADEKFHLALFYLRHEEALIFESELT